jgi:hypothetical protein
MATAICVSFFGNIKAVLPLYPRAYHQQTGLFTFKPPGPMIKKEPQLELLTVPFSKNEMVLTLRMQMNLNGSCTLARFVSENARDIAFLTYLGN